MREQDEAIAEQLKAQLVAAGLAAETERLDALLPGYRTLLAGVDRIAALDLFGVAPGFVLALPGMEPPSPEPGR